MGGTTWKSHIYAAASSARVAATGSTFAYTATTSTTPRHTWHVHENLDPKKLNKDGKKIRESRDSDAHPVTTAVIVALDQTGSMSEVFDPIQKALPRLNGLLVGKGYLSDPQILFAALGDATNNEQAPVQVGQFESGNEMDEDLANVLIEGAGGGGGTESYELMAYFLDKYTAIDCFEKRGHKGFLFFVGDEHPYSRVVAQQVQYYLGDSIQEGPDTQTVFSSLTERYEVFYVLPKGAQHGSEKGMIDYWRKLIGPQNVLELDDPSGVSELIAATIGQVEGLELDEIKADLLATGASASTTKAVGTALANRTSGGGGAVAEVDRPLPELTSTDEDSAAERV
jgi:hypothetical protein